jgi:hypothetical protein
MIGIGAQTLPQSNRVKNRQVNVILQRLERSSNKFRSSLNLSLVQAQIDQTKSGNDISSFETGFETATHQFRSTFGRGLAGVADVESVLRQATLVNGFMTRNRLNRQVQNDWTAVRTDLNGLASAYGLQWDWNRTVSQTTNASGSLQMSDGDIGKLIQRIETGGDTFRTSLTEAFASSPYDRTFNESQMNNAVRSLKKDTNQLRIEFDNGQPLASYVERLLSRATPIDTYLQGNLQTNQVQNDWQTLRADLNRLAGAFNLAVNWRNAAAASK